MDGKDVEAVLEAYRRAELDISSAVKRRQALYLIGGTSASAEVMRLTADIERKMDLKLAVEHAMEALEPVEYDIVRARGIERRPWVKICWKVNYSRTWCSAKYKAAILKLAESGLLDEFAKLLVGVSKNNGRV